MLVVSAVNALLCVRQQGFFDFVCQDVSQLSCVRNVWRRSWLVHRGIEPGCRTPRYRASAVKLRTIRNVNLALVLLKPQTKRRTDGCRPWNSFNDVEGSMHKCEVFPFIRGAGHGATASQEVTTGWDEAGTLGEKGYGIQWDSVGSRFSISHCLHALADPRPWAPLKYLKSLQNFPVLLAGFSGTRACCNPSATAWTICSYF